MGIYAKECLSIKYKGIIIREKQGDGFLYFLVVVLKKYT